MSIIETMRLRVSCRTFGDIAIEPDKMERLAESLASNAKAPFGNKVRFELINFDHLEMRELKTLGTYGVIKGARQFIAGALVDQPRAMEDFGYCMEKNILTATAMGLGTCWLVGTFKRSGFAERMNLAKGELLPAVTPIGYPGDSRSLIDRFFRISAGSDKRKPWEELFYDGGMETPLDGKSAGGYATPLACVRIGPSASNKQPWRIIRDNDSYHFYLKKTPGYGRIVEPVKLQNIDMGIAMCHFELASREAGLNGLWKIEDPLIQSGDLEYIVSWMG